VFTDTENETVIILADTENVAVKLGFLQMWLVFEVWNATDCNDSQDQLQNNSFSHV
jgi:hypothetical protein